MNDTSQHSARILLAAAIAGLTSTAPANAADDAVRGKMADRSTVTVATAPENTELQKTPTHGGVPFMISVDGEHVSGISHAAQHQRKTDLALEQVDVQIKFDGLGVQPRLNVSTRPVRRTFRPGDLVEFFASWNYPAWIASAEIRIFHDKDDTTTPRAIVPVSRRGLASWIMPQTDDTDGEFRYVLRVYDRKGRYDETAPLSIAQASRRLRDNAPKEPTEAPGYGDDRTAVRNIPVFGGAVTVHGKGVPQGFGVKVQGDQIPVDREGKFVVQRILPPGDHNISVGLGDGAKNGLHFEREINIPENEWFYVGIADLTLGHRFDSAKLENTQPGQYDKTYKKGRLAFYLKGKIRGKYLLTAAADTREEDLEDLFRGFDAKDPRQLLRRLDPDDYYAVYGDDSTTREDAPTRGKFYVRLERGKSSVMWGSFRTSLKGTHFLRTERGLYGAKATYNSDATTSFGEARTHVNAYAAQPGTLPQRDTLRGTGGSAYFLTRQDITFGSETISVEIRNETTDRVEQRQTLRFGQDYDIDYIQGVIILKKPLSSTVGDSGAVRTGALGGERLFLIAQYEYTPAGDDLDGYSYAARAQQWIGEQVRIGGIGIKENTGPADQNVVGADILVRRSEKTFVRAEIAQSEGPGFGRSRSTDGGLTISSKPPVGSRGQKAEAYRVAAAIDFGELTDGAIEGSLSGNFEQIDAGFASIDRAAEFDERAWTIRLVVQPDGPIGIKVEYDELDRGDGKRSSKAEGELFYDVNPSWRASIGVQHIDREGLASVVSRTGRRTDLGGKLRYKYDEDTLIYAFGQGTVERSGTIADNHRGGLGAKTRITDKIGLEAEASYGSGGFGGLAAITYDPTVDDHYYFGYRLDPDRTDQTLGISPLVGTDFGGIVFGARRKLNETLTAFAENKHDIFGQKLTLTQAYGVTYTPDEFWTVTGGAEFGRIDAEHETDFDRNAVSMAIGYSDTDRLKAKLRGEARFEDSEDGLRDRNTYLIAAGASIATTPGWRAIAKIDAVISDSDQSTILDGDYIEASTGYAYRGVTDDRVNALFKYTFLYDLPGPDQVTATGARLGPKQRSHILSADATVDVTEYLSVGGKYGVRIGEVSASRSEDDFIKSSAHLGVLRLDLHLVKDWDLIVEGRVLHTPEAGSTDVGFVGAVYRHIGNNLKVGIGYNFGQFSDDLSDLTADDHGVFLNVVGKF